MSETGLPPVAGRVGAPISNVAASAMAVLKTQTILATLFSYQDKQRDSIR